MRIIFIVIVFLFTSCQSYKKLHEKAIVVDTHNDVLSTVSMRGLNWENDLRGKAHSDIQRFKQGGVDVQIFSIWCDGRKENAYNYANVEIDSLYAMINRNPDKLMLVKTPAELKAAVQQKKLGCMIGVEGGHMLEDRLDYLDSFYNRGSRYLTLTHNVSTSWASSAMDETKTPDPDGETKNITPGLNDFGKQVVRRMNELGMMVDVSHVGDKTFWDVIEVSTKPVIASHSCAYTLCPVFRNLKDDQIKAIAKNGGVIFLNFFSGFVDSNYLTRIQDFNKKHKTERDSLRNLKWSSYEIDEWMSKTHSAEAEVLRPHMNQLLDHLDYIVNLSSADHVGLGSDFDGVSSTPRPLDDVSTFPLITKALLERGYSKKDIRKILGENFIRVFNANMN